MCGKHNVRATARDNTGQDRDKGHTPSLKIKIKILNPAGNRTRAAGLEDGGSTNYATWTDLQNYNLFEVRSVILKGSVFVM